MNSIPIPPIKSTKIDQMDDGMILKKIQTHSKMIKEKTETFLSIYQQWVWKVCDEISIHGFIWHNRTMNSGVRLLILGFTLIIIFGLPTFLCYQVVKFSQNAQINNDIEWESANKVKYPNITICHPRYFDLRLLKKFSLSESTANYMTMVLGKGGSRTVEIRNYPQLESAMDLGESQLQATLKKHNLTVVELFREVAVRCEDFIPYCDLHGAVFYADPRHPNQTSCCDRLFRGPPIFTPAGTCFVSTEEVWEFYPFIFSSLKFWVDMLTNVTLEPMIMFRGSGAIQQFGALYVVSSTDHPFAKLMQAPLRAMPGTVSTIGLTTTITDRRQLQADLCTFKNESFESQYGIEYSKLNCEILSIANDFSGCSVTPYYGLSEQDNLPICTPALLQKENFSIRKESRVSSDSCKYDCIQSDFRAEVTTGSLFLMENVEDRHSDPLNKRDTIVLEMHMKSFDFEKQIQYYDSFLDFLSKIGGWLGLVFGASIISFFEIFYFLIYLLIKLVSRHSP